MNNKKGLLIRVGIDQTFGEYNAPINPENNDYLYMPIPQGDNDFRFNMRTSYNDLIPHFNLWARRNRAQLSFPEHLKNKATHLDPDFDYSTYGDQASGRGLRIGQLKSGDFIAFFASFRPTKKCNHRLVYALYGMMIVDKVLKASDVPEPLLRANAHTRISNMNDDHWIVFADPTSSGRFDRAIPIGEFRDKSYRVTNAMLDLWGGIGVKNGYIQRSVNPPWFDNPEQFLEWIHSQQVILINRNWQ